MTKTLPIAWRTTPYEYMPHLSHANTAQQAYAAHKTGGYAQTQPASGEPGNRARRIG